MVDGGWCLVSRQSAKRYSVPRGDCARSLGSPGRRRNHLAYVCLAQAMLVTVLLLGFVDGCPIATLSNSIGGQKHLTTSEPLHLARLYAACAWSDMVGDAPRPKKGKGEDREKVERISPDRAVYMRTAQYSVPAQHMVIMSGSSDGGRSAGIVHYLLRTYYTDVGSVRSERQLHLRWATGSGPHDPKRSNRMRSRAK